MNPATGQLASFYESLPAAKINSWLVDFLPPPPAPVLEVGSGSGRDAAWLAQAGFAVTAVEPDAVMRAEARHRHPQAGFKLRSGSLPGLGFAARPRFAFILANAVWMFIRPDQRSAAAAELAALLLDGGSLAVTLRHPIDRQRGMHEVDRQTLLAEFAALGLAARHISKAADLQRPAVTWQRILLTKDNAEL